MEIYGTTSHKVEIDPKTVIKKLIQAKLGLDRWISCTNGKYYKNYEAHKRYTETTEISKEVYDYIKALELVLSELA